MDFAHFRKNLNLIWDVNLPFSTKFHLDKMEIFRFGWKIEMLSIWIRRNLYEVALWWFLISDSLVELWKLSSPSSFKIRFQDPKRMVGSSSNDQEASTKVPMDLLKLHVQ
jgi:hypothetical protein